MTKTNRIAHFFLSALPWIIAAMALVFLFQKCEANKRANANIAVLQGEVSQYQNKIGSLTTTVGTLQLTNKQLEQTLLAKDDSLQQLANEFANIEAIVITETETIIDSIPVPFEVPVPCEFERVGKKFNDWYQFAFKVNQNGLQLNDVQLFNEQTTITGFKRNWFLGRQRMTTDVTNSNPYMTTTHVESVEVVIPKRFYDTRLFNLGIGFLAGAYLFSR